MYNVEYDFRTGILYAVSDGTEGKALELFVNLQTPNTKKELEEKLRDVLQGKEEKYESIDEHTQIFADKSETLVKSFITPGEKEPISNRYPTRNVYWLLCKYNVLYDNFEQMKKGAKTVTPPLAEIDRRMSLITPSEEQKKM